MLDSHPAVGGADLQRRAPAAQRSGDVTLRPVRRRQHHGGV